MGKISIEPFKMEQLEDYYKEFNEEITRYQWPDPFESIEDAKELLQSFLDEAEQGETILLSAMSEDGQFIGGMKLLRKFENEYEIIEQDVEKLSTDSGKELELQGFVLKARK